MSNGARTVSIPRHTSINALTMGKLPKTQAVRHSNIGNC